MIALDLVDTFGRLFAQDVSGRFNLEMLLAHPPSFQGGSGGARKTKNFTIRITQNPQFPEKSE
jgi:ribosomal protein S6E (S10)